MSPQNKSKPWVRLKIAASLDGKTALSNGQSQWITSPIARADGHEWRARCDAVLTGIGTVLKDNPRLDTRLASVPQQTSIVVIDSQLNTPLNAHIFIAQRPCYIYASVQNGEKEAALEAIGATVVYMPGANRRVDLIGTLADLHSKGIKKIHIEAGHQLNGAFIREGLVDEFLIYLAPKLLGQALGMANFGPLDDLSKAVELEFVEIRQLGPDVLLRAKANKRVASPQA